jgi:hypothetical protein
MRAGAKKAVLLGALGLLLALAALAQGEVVQKGKLRVSFNGQIAPKALPREGTAPIKVSVGGQITTSDGSPPPSLAVLEIEINRHGHLDYRGLPVCPLEEIQPATSQNALAACRASLVGEGAFAANVAIPEQSPFPSEGKLLAFNGREDGKPVIFAHVYGTEPVPTSLTLPMAISAIPKGRFGTLLRASLPRVAANIAFVSAISLTLQRTFSYRGERHGYLSSGCPAPAGFPGTVFALARASFSFAGGRRLSTTLNRSCRVR